MIADERVDKSTHIGSHLFIGNSHDAFFLIDDSIGGIFNDYRLVLKVIGR